MTLATVYTPEAIADWSASAQSVSGASAGEIIEAGIPVGSTVAFLLTTQPDTSQTLDEFVQANNCCFCLITTTSTSGTATIYKVVSGVRTALWSYTWSITTPPQDDQGVNIGAWIRVVRSYDGLYWGVQFLYPDLGSQAASIIDYPWGSVETDTAGGIQYATDSLGSSSATLQVWLRNITDQWVALKSGYTGSYTFASAAYLYPVTKLKTDGTSYTRASVLFNEAPMGRTYTRAPTIYPLSKSTGTSYTKATANTSVGGNLILRYAVAGSDHALASASLLFLAPTISAGMYVAGSSATLQGGAITFAPMLLSGRIVIRQNGTASLSMQPLAMNAAASAIAGGVMQTYPMQVHAGVLSVIPYDQITFGLDGMVFTSVYKFSMTENPSVSDSTTKQNRTNAISTSDNVQGSDSITTSAKRTGGISDTALALDSMFMYQDNPMVSADVVVWVVNTDTMASSKYQNFGFNSFFHYDGKDYGVADDGVYELEGLDDDGIEIDALLDAGVTDFGTDRRISLRNVYFGGVSSRKFKVNLIADGISRIYEARTASDSLNLNRVDCGKGVSAKYWQIQLMNTEGADLQIDSVRLIPLTKTRRV